MKKIVEGAVICYNVLSHHGIDSITIPALL
ncbi:unnamed protein product, partial [Vitis vinifera]|uniref:Uncharacterized protein n=1 Tax=Vitis vinifera TaxID=29760 RepID=D7U6A3_VITVI